MGPNGKVIGLKDLLIFCSGGDEVPVLGYKQEPTVSFIHPEDVAVHLAGLPFANTCMIALQLPIVADFDTFKANMLAAIEMVCTFTSE
jgi:hypothetical protein